MCTDYTNINKVFPKDAYPLPSIDKLVGGAATHEFMSFLNAYFRYNQISMHDVDKMKTAFMTDKANLCYKVMPFSLKNEGGTHQRLMDRVFQEKIGRNMKVYIDDMIVKLNNLG